MRLCFYLPKEEAQEGMPGSASHFCAACDEWVTQSRKETEENRSKDTMTIAKHETECKRKGGRWWKTLLKRSQHTVSHLNTKISLRTWYTRRRGFLLTLSAARWAPI